MLRKWFNDLPPLKQWFTASIVVLIYLSLVFYSYVLPELNKNEKAKKYFEHSNARLEQLNAKNRPDSDDELMKQKLLKELEQVDLEMVRLGVQALSKEEFHRIIMVFLSNPNVKVSKVSPSTSDLRTKKNLMLFQSREIIIELKGSYNDIVSFNSAIKETRVPFTVNEYSVSRGEYPDLIARIKIGYMLKE